MISSVGTPIFSRSYSCSTLPSIIDCKELVCIPFAGLVVADIAVCRVVDGHEPILALVPLARRVRGKSAACGIAHGKHDRGRPRLRHEHVGIVRLSVAGRRERRARALKRPPLSLSCHAALIDPESSYRSERVAVRLEQ